MSAMTAQTGLTVGPVLYHWTRDAMHAFYARMADSPADRIVLGETVCSRRRELKLDDWLALARELSQAGKQVVLATQALVESESDLRLIRKQAEQQEFLVEASDASALRLLSGRLAGREFLLSSFINIYSRPSLQFHADLGATGWLAPAELSLASLAKINPPDAPVCTPSGQAVQTEVLGFGRLPLALSARCFTARHHHLNKDECEFRCAADADGLLLQSTEGEDFLVLNGIQTQSAALHCLLGEGAALRAAGVSRLRLSPCSQSFDEVLRLFDRTLNQGLDVKASLAELQALPLPGRLANGYARGQAGMKWTESVLEMSA